jgi:hypothetical protein
MITKDKLDQLMGIGADQMTELLQNAGYDNTDEPILNTHFKGVAAHGSIMNFVYDAMYLDTHNTGSIAYADLIVSYNPITKEISADYRG